jgi:polysaccharide biosynthesis transport protein
LVARLRYFNLDRPTQVVLVASSLPQEGKSMVAWHLAKAAAVAGSRTLLIEADLHRRTLSGRHSLVPGPGLAETLPLGGTALPDVIQRVPLVGGGPDALGPQESYLDVLVAGAPPPNPAALLESRRMEDLLVDARAQYDFVVIDSPPTSAVADVYPLVRRVDGVIVVARVGRSERPSLLDLRRQLSGLNAPVLGVVVNGAPARQRRYGYEGYGYAATPPSSPSEPRDGRTADPSESRSDSPVSP